ncbi:MAG: DUF4340 domain-containing protein [Planctomycetes bacterium]|jgi:hypothetical protein|nr:DUF4340 domain-containing protein [Planctomycetota bacterium]
MKARNILVLLTLLAVCAVALLIDRIDCDADRGQPGASRTLFEDLDAAIRTLRIEPADGQAIEIVLDGEAARLVEPVSAPANAEKATSLVELLKTLSYTRAFAPAAEEGLGDPQTGLDQPRLDVSFTDADGKQYRLLIGREAPTLGTGIVETYVRPARSGRTFVVAQDLAATSTPPTRPTIAT